MSFVLPNPNTPTNGQPGDATPILQNEQAIAQAIAAFDGSQINTKSVTENALADTINPRLRGLETLANFVYSGCIWSALSGANGTMTGGTIYVNGYRTIVSGVGSNTFTLSNDTYVDIDYLGNLTYNGVSNNATAPSLTANAVRVAKIVTNGSAITSVVQAQNADGVGNIIYPVGPNSPIKTQNPYKFSVYRNTAWTTGAPALVQFDTKEYDTGNNVDIVTNKGRFTAPIAGFYFFTSTVGCAAQSGNAYQIYLYKNGSSFKSGIKALAAGTFDHSATVTATLQLAANDYIEVYFYHGGVAGDTGSGVTYFQGKLESVT